MGLTTTNFPPVDPEPFFDLPYRERLRQLTRHWAEYGFGAPKMIMFIYIFRMLLFTAGCGVLAATLTSHLNPFNPSEWFDKAIVWQKLVVWMLLIESLGMGGSWGPLSGHFKPMSAGFRHYFRVGTIRLPPWTRVPFTKGDERTVVDVVLYTLLIASYIAAIAIPGEFDAGLRKAVGIDNEGLMAVASVLPIIVLLVTLGLRDKIIFLAARSEQYLPALIFFAFFPFVDMIVAAKILIVAVWVGAGLSKLNKHFGLVIPPMVSNTPWLSSRRIKRMHYRKFPEDLRPSKTAKRLSDIPGTAFEVVVPLVLLFTTNHALTLIAAIIMLGYCVFIISCFPLATPIEWNVMFMYLIGFLFLSHANGDGYGLADMNVGLLILTVVGMVTFPIWGNLRPAQISFLPSLRQYGGNWASGMWALAPGVEHKFNDHVKKASLMQHDQLAAEYGEGEGRVILQHLLAWRSMHSQGRGMNSVMINTLGEDIDSYNLLEPEFASNALIGWNFGDGHLHDERLVEALQRRCHFAPGEFIVVWVESESVLSGRQEYRVIDAAVGIVERGSWSVADCADAQPWLPDGPVPTKVSWRMEGYERVRHPRRPTPAAPEAGANGTNTNEGAGNAASGTAPMTV